MLPRSPSSSTLVMVSKGMPTLVNQAATASLLGASITQRALPSARLAKLRYPLTSGSCCAACANWRSWSAENFPAGRVCVHMNFAITFISFFFVNHFLESSFKDEPYRQPRPYGLKGDAANENSTPLWIGAHPEVVGNGRRGGRFKFSKANAVKGIPCFPFRVLARRHRQLQGARVWIGARRGSINEPE